MKKFKYIRLQQKGFGCFQHLWEFGPLNLHSYNDKVPSPSPNLEAKSEKQPLRWQYEPPIKHCYELPKYRSISINDKALLRGKWCQQKHHSSGTLVMLQVGHHKLLFDTFEMCKTLLPRTDWKDLSKLRHNVLLKACGGVAFFTTYCTINYNEKLSFTLTYLYAKTIHLFQSERFRYCRIKFHSWIYLQNSNGNLSFSLREGMITKILCLKHMNAK